ncbi:MAG: hypothetical protein DME79_01250, partial [Verrucomicrobia bacterium]
QNRINRQFNGKSSQTFGSLFFHPGRDKWRIEQLSRGISRLVTVKNRAMMGFRVGRFNDLAGLAKVARRLISGQIDCVRSVSS